MVVSTVSYCSLGDGTYEGPPYKVFEPEGTQGQEETETPERRFC